MHMTPPLHQSQDTIVRCCGEEEGRDGLRRGHFNPGHGPHGGGEALLALRIAEGAFLFSGGIACFVSKETMVRDCDIINAGDVVKL